MTRIAAAAAGRDRRPEPVHTARGGGRPLGGRRAAPVREAGSPFERPLLDLALDVYRTVDRSASWLVNQDLHGGNVLRAEREPWLVIDPKPLVGERELEASGPLRNTDDVTRWLDALVDIGFDRERARGWGVAHNLAWAWDERDGWLAKHVEDARRIFNAR